MGYIDEFMEDKPQSQFESEERGSYIHAVLTLLGKARNVLTVLLQLRRLGGGEEQPYALAFAEGPTMD